MLDGIKNGSAAIKVLCERIKPSLRDATDFISACMRWELLFYTMKVSGSYAYRNGVACL